MKLVVFGLTISSSWGNGHATLWRGLARALAAKGHRMVFFERDVSWYASARDYWHVPGGDLVLYRHWPEIVARAQSELEDCDAAIVTSYCPDAITASERMFEIAPFTVFYDLDTPITLGRLERGEGVPYIGARGLADFDLVLSFTGGGALEALRLNLQARRVEPLYGHVDPELHRPVAANEIYRADLSYLGTYAADRQHALERFFVEAARARPSLRFVIAGAQYPKDFPWSPNIWFVRHLPPSEHPAFFASSHLTLNITRGDMARMGWCPSGRLFEAAACGCPIVSDAWEGFDSFFEPGEEVLTAKSTDDVLSALDSDDDFLRQIARRARERVLSQHTSAYRADELLSLLDHLQHGRATACSALAAEA